MKFKMLVAVAGLCGTVSVSAQTPSHDVASNPKFWKAMAGMVTLLDVTTAAGDAMRAAGGPAAASASGPQDIAWNGKGFLVATSTPARCFVPVDNGGSKERPKWQAGAVTCL